MATSTPTKLNVQLPQSTPYRDRERSLHPLRSDSSASTFSSPTSQRVAHSAMSSSAAAPSTVTVDTLLANHSSSSNPHLSALDAIVADRNNLSAQNAQLWKVIEKQKLSQAQMLKEIERIRGERDAYRTKLHSLGEDTDALLKAHRDARDKGRREAKDSALRATASQPRLRPGENGTASSSSNKDPRSTVLRTNSDDLATRTNTRHLNHSYSRDPSSQSHSTVNGRPRQGSQSSINASASQISSTYLSASQASSSSNISLSSSTSVPPSSSSSMSNLPPSIPERSQESRKPSPLTLNPVRAESLPTALSVTSNGPSTSISTASTLSTPSSSLPPNSALSPQRNPDSAPPGSWNSSRNTANPQLPIRAPHPGSLNAISPAISTPGSSLPSSTLSETSTRRSEDAGTSSSARALQLQASPKRPTIQLPPELQALAAPPVNSSELTVPSRPTLLSRESRISLPEEAKRYYATMGDSPMPSPRLGSESPEKHAVALGAGGGGPMVTETPPTVKGRGIVVVVHNHDDEPTSPLSSGGRRPSADHRRSAEEFLELDDEDSMYDSTTGGSERVSVADSGEPDDDEGDSPHVGNQSARNGKKRVAAAVEDFPLPPSTPPFNPAAESSYAVAQMQALAAQRTQTETSILSSDTRSVSEMSSRNLALSESRMPLLDPHSTSTSSLGQTLGDQPPVSPFLQSLTQKEPPQAKFRALPLLASDLPNTQIHVSYSSIRANERGKEVLSFVISVDPGSGKDAWNIEKLYSDVLTLDSRVRSSLGRSLGKKMASLPEGRLWKDHAPAKVDQRKAALESYLRSLIALPVKNKDEIVAFFTSDILREAQKPVSQAGYKEGYLTKRGKNFGGWKTRYFVLQGPSLEYYESRGGTHLGSITITGAQIGRQQKSADRRDSDEDNDYRHAFLIIEAKKGPGVSSSRHVLCAQSDKERDNWVEELVRYVSGTYNEDEVVVVQNSSLSPGRVSTSAPAPVSPPEILSPPTRRLRKEDPSAKGPPGGAPVVLIPQQHPPALDASSSGNARSFQNTPAPPEDPTIHTSRSPVKSVASQSSSAAELKGTDPPLSSSLPAASPLASASEDVDVIGSMSQRATSELGHYPDLVDPREQSAPAKGRMMGRMSPEVRRRDNKRRSINPLKHSPIPERASSPEKESGLQTPRADTSTGRVKISGPMNGTPIPPGYKFGSKDAAPSETSDRREKAKSRTFWFGRQHDKPNAPALPPRAVFGVSLEESLDVAQIGGLPAIVFRCIQYLEAKKAEQEEGIYRLSGSSAVIKSLKDRFNIEGDVDLLATDEYWDPHAIAGLLKTFLRELPASILTRDLHLRFLAVIDFVDSQERINELSHLIAALPVANYSLLRALTAHLILIVQNANVNKMTMRNVGIVFSPTLGIPAGVFSLMLGEFKRVFNVDGTLADEEGEPNEEKEEASQSEDYSRRNSKHYLDAAADKMLGLSGRALNSSEEVQSDEGEELSVHDDSGVEDTTAENESIVESSGTSNTIFPGQQTSHQIDHLHPSDYSSGNGASGRSHAAVVAASRGLNITVGGDKGSRRRSRVVGLPSSPRPQHAATSPHTPRTPQNSIPSAPASPATGGSVSPLQTPK